MKENNLFRIPALLLFSSCAMLMVQTSCRHDGLDVTKLDKVCYDTDIARIFSSCNATGCHSAASQKGGYSFTDYNSVMKAITPGNAQKSKAYQAITGKKFVQLMPPSGAIPEADRILLRVWIDQGADGTPCATTIPTTGGTAQNKDYKTCFQRDVLPVLLSSCGIAGCHDQTSHKEGYNVSTYATVMSNLVKSGSPSTSKLYSVISRSPSSENFMPPKPYTALSSAVKDSIYAWIKDGASNDVCVATCDTVGVITYSKQIATLVAKNCNVCHSGANASKGILLDSYAGIKTYLDNGKLLAAVKGTSIQMPPGYILAKCEIRELELWKLNGALQN